MNRVLDSGRLIRPIGVVALVIGLVTVVTVALGPPYLVPVTDVGRDVIGAHGAAAGVSPYQRLGDLRSYVPYYIEVHEASSYPVAHPPLAIAVAWGLSTMAGPATETVVRVMSWFALGFVATWLGLFAASRLTTWHGVAGAGAVAASLGLAPDIWYLNGGAIAAMALIAVFELERSRFRLVGLILLGLLVAWKPWLAPVACFLPHRRRALVDVGMVASIAVTANLIGTMGMGGIAAFLDWVRLMVPLNLAEETISAWNLSLIGGHIPPQISGLVFVGATIVGLLVSRYIERDRWLLLAVVVIAIASPLVWHTYWLTMTPLLVLGFRRSSFVSLLLVLLLLSDPLARLGPVTMQVIVVCVVGIILVEMVEVGSPTVPRVSIGQNEGLLPSQRLTFPVEPSPDDR